MRFRDADPVRRFNDRRPIPVPESSYGDRLSFYASSRPSKPQAMDLKISSGEGARDINAWDDVPASSWFTPRLGYREISPDELVKGPAEFGPPQLPLVLMKFRLIENRARLLVSDRRGLLYMIKMDPPDFPAISTTAAVIVNRLFWGVGYNVAENHVLFFRREDLRIDPSRGLNEAAIDTVLGPRVRKQDELHRAVAVRILDGLPLGPTPENGVRRDDPNDLFPHQDRRTLRALRVFSALVNLCDISADNTLDLYEMTGDRGCIMHYLIDFDAALGSHAARGNRSWAGFNHLFSFSEVLNNALTLGLKVQDWERIRAVQWKSVGLFESEQFRAEKWKETHPFAPIRNSQPADDYWAAKIVNALTSAHIEALVRAAQYPEPGAGAYVAATLMERRRKIVDHFYSCVTPLEVLACGNTELLLRDLGSGTEGGNGSEIPYRVRMCSDRGRKVQPESTIHTTASGTLRIPITEKALRTGDDYVVVLIESLGCSENRREPAQFHLRRNERGELKVVGVKH